MILDVVRRVGMASDEVFGVDLFSRVVCPGFLDIESICFVEVNSVCGAISSIRLNGCSVSVFFPSMETLRGTLKVETAVDLLCARKAVCNIGKLCENFTKD